MPDTRARVLPMHRAQSLEDYLVYLKHLALYKFVSSYTARKRVLDLGCGEGYGSDALAHTAHFVVAAARDVNVVAHARQKYVRANLAFVICDAQYLPFRAESFATVISFEVIEQIPSVRKYLEEIKRVNAVGGVAIVSTPNRVLRLLPFQKPWNRFHLREYAARDLARAVAATFPRVQLRGITATSAILEIEKRRVRQNPFIAYPEMIARMIVPNEWLHQIKARLRRPVAARGELFDAMKFSVDDFRVSENGLRECINLIAASGL
ncbi:MAG: class I SAM-dependent methyltransferase [Anaerolineales bacterium]|nr:class I SAM-dependent methyltransferase [Anaerolineales bacterium]